jgi:hypothetical protein
VGGVMGALQLPPFSDIMKHLGYPPFFMTIIGAPRCREWVSAYNFILREARGARS